MIVSPASVGSVELSRSTTSRPPWLVASDEATAGPLPVTIANGSTVDSEDQAAWDTVFNADEPSVHEGFTAFCQADEPPIGQVSRESRSEAPSAIAQAQASEPSHAGSSSDDSDSRRPPSTRFELLLTDSSFLQVDWSRQSTHWSLCLRTDSAQSFGVFSNAKQALCMALEAGLGQGVAVEVVQR